MKYKSYQSEFIRCPECGNYIDPESMMCRKCGLDYEKEIRNGKSTDSKNRYQTKKHR
jgi:uncharacterized OB-fold protein